MATLITTDDVRVTRTPNAVMTTYASPTLGGTVELSLWRVEMEAGGVGPVHTFDTEQVWTVVSGEAEIVADDARYRLRAGDTGQLAAGEVRQVRAVSEVVFVVCGSGRAIVTAAGAAANGTTPPWIA